MTGKPITTSKNPERQEVINAMRVRKICITKSPNGDLFFVEEDNPKLTQQLRRFGIGCRYGFLVFPDMGDAFHSATEAFDALYYAYRCIEAGDPDENF